MARNVICPSCEYIGPPKKKKRGSGKIELMCWLMFPLGLPYTIWRMFARYPVCRICSNEMLLEEDSIIGKRVLAKVEAEMASIKPIQKKPDTPGVMPPEPKHALPPREQKSWRPEQDKDQF
jgi:hypothetical protein